MSTFKSPAEKQIDPSKLKAWIHMAGLQRAGPHSAPAFVYIKDIEPETAGPWLIQSDSSR